MSLSTVHLSRMSTVVSRTVKHPNCDLVDIFLKGETPADNIATVKARSVARKVFRSWNLQILGRNGSKYLAYASCVSLWPGPASKRVLHCAKEDQIDSIGFDTGVVLLIGHISSLVDVNSADCEQRATLLLNNCSQQRKESLNARL
jgi:hypothetical protein